MLKNIFISFLILILLSCVAWFAVDRIDQKYKHTNMYTNSKCALSVNAKSANIGCHKIAFSKIFDKKDFNTGISLLRRNCIRGHFFSCNFLEDLKEFEKIKDINTNLTENEFLCLGSKNLKIYDRNIYCDRMIEFYEKIDDRTSMFKILSNMDERFHDWPRIMKNAKSANPPDLDKFIKANCNTKNDKSQNCEVLKQIYYDINIFWNAVISLYDCNENIKCQKSNIDIIKKSQRLIEPQEYKQTLRELESAIHRLNNYEFSKWLFTENGKNFDYLDENPLESPVVKNSEKIITKLCLEDKNHFACINLWASKPIDLKRYCENTLDKRGCFYSITTFSDANLRIKDLEEYCKSGDEHSCIYKKMVESPPDYYPEEFKKNFSMYDLYLSNDVFAINFKKNNPLLEIGRLIDKFKYHIIAIFIVIILLIQIILVFMFYRLKLVISHIQNEMLEKIKNKINRKE
jgi:hypothetical protein